MSARWPDVALGEVLTHRKESIKIDDLVSYKRCRVQLHSKGIVLRDCVEGAAIKTKTQQVCRSGEFLVAEIDAKVGGYGVVPLELDGSIVSSHYFLYVVNRHRLDPRFLGWFAKTPAFAEQVEAQGSTNYAAIRPQDVLGYTIPLPPLSEQRRIVAKIEGLAAKVGEASWLLRAATEETDALQTSYDARAFLSLEKRHGAEPIEQVLVDAAYGTSAKCAVERADEAWPILRIPNVASEALSLENLKYAELSPSEQRKLSLQEGDLLIVRTNGSADLVGRCAVVHELPEPTGFASYLIRMRVDMNRVTAEYVQRVLRHLRNSGKLFDCARTTAGQYNVSLGRLRTALIPIPPIAVQRQVVEGVDGVFRELARTREHRKRIDLELNALMPSILDRAFQGEL